MERKTESRLAQLGKASSKTKGNGGHMIELAGLWQRAGIDRE